MMKNMAALTIDHTIFSAEVEGSVCILTFKEKPLLYVTDLKEKKDLFDFLELLSQHDEIKVLLIKSAPVKMRCQEYINFYRNKISCAADIQAFNRKYNALCQLTQILTELNKVIVHADSGNVLLLHLNVGLACDYRIISENTIYQNPNVDLNVIPTGGCVYFLSKILGRATAFELLLSRDEISASRAHELGLVDEVVPKRSLDQIALEKAHSFAELSLGYCIGIKKLLNSGIGELNRFLEYEHSVLVRSHKQR
ncbi:MAG: enoyl-CoA hydratase/isomerase family protein [Desulfuromusa sp.]|jgi:2-(1,2-epoxy-1,2-dihydrophenyl)acetyl-CoA isomerase|nr:enoyl-CoA hydratase/isomerase family protein [Desulfuromusa sp.]